jgi:hypothetical protein
MKNGQIENGTIPKFRAGGMPALRNPGGRLISTKAIYIIIENLLCMPSSESMPLQDHECSLAISLKFTEARFLDDAQTLVVLPGTGDGNPAVG